MWGHLKGHEPWLESAVLSSSLCPTPASRVTEALRTLLGLRPRAQEASASASAWPLLPVMPLPDFTVSPDGCMFC